MKRKYTATAKRGPIRTGQLWRSAQSRDHGRTVRVVKCLSITRYAVAPLGRGRCDSIVSDRTLRQGYALVGFWLVSARGRRVGPVETHKEALTRRLAAWARSPGTRLGIAGAYGLANKVASGHEAERARKVRG